MKYGKVKQLSHATVPLRWNTQLVTAEILICILLSCINHDQGLCEDLLTYANYYSFHLITIYQGQRLGKGTVAQDLAIKFAFFFLSIIKYQLAHKLKVKLPALHIPRPLNIASIV